VNESDLRMQRTVASLRAAEALRGYAGAHDGKPPETLADITDLPLVIDPQSGKGYEAFYKLHDGTAVLEVPPPVHQSALFGRRFELKAAR
jgi:hypothetical protein